MRRARIVRIEWDSENNPSLGLTEIQYALRHHFGFSILVCGEPKDSPSFTVKESG
jgi:hypothetical protein